MKHVDVIAGERIGALRLGMAKGALPAGTVLEAEMGGECSGVHFLLESGAVGEVWIPNLRTFPSPVHYNGKLLEQSVSVDELKRVFGPCSRVEGVIGGARYRCESGIVLGFDFKETGKLIQIRVRSKSAE